MTIEATQQAWNYEELKRDIAEAIRATLRELADEHGMSYEDYLDWYFDDGRQ
jgi:hypothetical protein